MWFSWFLFSCESQFGTPEDLKKFIATAHSHGIACIIDWVPNHMYYANILDRFDTIKTSPYFFQSDELRSTPFGPRFDFSKIEVNRIYWTFWGVIERERVCVCVCVCRCAITEAADTEFLSWYGLAWYLSLFICLGATVSLTQCTHVVGRI